MSYILDDFYEAAVKTQKQIAHLKLSERAHGSGGLVFYSINEDKPEMVYFSPAYDDISFDEEINGPVSVSIEVQNDIFENGEHTGSIESDSIPMTLTGDLDADLKSYFEIVTTYVNNHIVEGMFVIENKSNIKPSSI